MLPLPSKTVLVHSRAGDTIIERARDGRGLEVIRGIPGASIRSRFGLCQVGGDVTNLREVHLMKTSFLVLLSASLLVCTAGRADWPMVRGDAASCSDGGGEVFFGSSADCHVTALDASSGTSS